MRTILGTQVYRDFNSGYHLKLILTILCQKLFIFNIVTVKLLVINDIFLFCIDNVCSIDIIRCNYILSFFFIK